MELALVILGMLIGIALVPLIFSHDMREAVKDWVVGCSYYTVYPTYEVKPQSPIGRVLKPATETTELPDEMTPEEFSQMAKENPKFLDKVGAKK